MTVGAFNSSMLYAAVSLAVLIVGVTIIFWSEGRRGWHDRVAGTEVFSLAKVRA